MIKFGGPGTKKKACVFRLCKKRSLVQGQEASSHHDNEKQTSNVQEFDDPKDFIENQNNENEHPLDLPESYDCVVYLRRLQQDENLLADPQEDKQECMICGKSYV